MAAGDAFGNRGLPALIQPATPSEAGSLWMHMYGALQGDSRKKYGYDPWTKSSFLKDGQLKYWCFRPDIGSWHAAINYIAGSVLFTIASVFMLFNYVQTHVNLDRWFYCYPYALGSAMYTVGASILLVESWLGHPDNLLPDRDRAAPDPNAASGALVSRPATPGSVTPLSSPHRSTAAPPSDAAAVVVESMATGTMDSMMEQRLSWPQSNDDDEGGAMPVRAASLKPVRTASLQRNAGVELDSVEDEWLEPLPITPTNSVPTPSEAWRSMSASFRGLLPGLQLDRVTSAKSTDIRHFEPEALLASMSGPMDLESGKAASAPLPPTGESQKLLSPDGNDGAHKHMAAYEAHPVPLETIKPGSFHDSHHLHGDGQPPVVLYDGSVLSHKPIDVNGLPPIFETNVNDDPPSPTPTKDRASVGPITERPPSTVRREGKFGKAWVVNPTVDTGPNPYLSHRTEEDYNRSYLYAYNKDPHYYIHHDPWYRMRWRLDVTGSSCIWLGAVLYNVSCFSLGWKAWFRHLPFERLFKDHDLAEFVLETGPDDLGGVLFVVGSWLFWWSAHSTPWPWGPKPFTLLWWLTVCNFFGSVGFLLGAVVTTPIEPIKPLVNDWVELVIGYALGSALFTVGSYLMLVEVASYKVKEKQEATRAVPGGSDWRDDVSTTQVAVPPVISAAVAMPPKPPQQRTPVGTPTGRTPPK